MTAKTRRRGTAGRVNGMDDGSGDDSGGTTAAGSRTGVGDGGTTAVGHGTDDSAAVKSAPGDDTRAAGPGDGGDGARNAADTPRGGHTVRGAARLRAWTVGWTTGVAQALGAALLLITECVRYDVAPLGGRVVPGTELPGYAHDFPHWMDAVDGQWWFRAAEEVRDAIGFGEPRAALWAAVCAALVVRFNADGPPRLQCVLSGLGAVYCLAAVVSAVPFLALAGAALPFALLVGALAVMVATPAARRRFRTTV